jgi:very-short-patch-repair endonuclease
LATASQWNAVRVKRTLKQLGPTGGVILRREALARGYHDRAIAALVRQGHWVRVRHGAYVPTDHWASLSPAGRHRVLARAVLTTAKSPAVLSHLTAAIEHGADVWDLDLSEVHITRLDGGCGRREAGVQQHRGLIRPEWIMEHDGVQLLNPTRTAIDVTRICDVEHGLVVVNGLLHQGDTTLPEMEDMAAEMDCFPFTLNTRLVLRLADPRIESVGESRTAYLLWAQGLPAFEPQYKIRDASGQVLARVDFALPELGVFLEFDGRQKYGELLGDKSLEQVLVEEREREKMICRLTGWVCIRITWADLAHPERLAAEIRAILRSRRPSA